VVQESNDDGGDEVVAVKMKKIGPIQICCGDRADHQVCDAYQPCGNCQVGH
jgi:hypothetical protein